MLARLEKFKKALSVESTVSRSEPEGGGDDNVSDWKDVRLKFAPDSGKVSPFFCHI